MEIFIVISDEILEKTLGISEISQRNNTVTLTKHPAGVIEGVHG